MVHFPENLHLPWVFVFLHVIFLFFSFFIISCTVKLLYLIQRNFGNNVAHVAIKNRPEFVVCMFALVMSEFSASNSRRPILYP
jgi:hypothetical protein